MTQSKNAGKQDVIVIGGGAAGMMAAGRAAEQGAKVVLVEKTYRLGSKLLITGGGRCNITNSADLGDFVRAFGENGKFLYRALHVFSNRDLMEFFSVRGVDMRVDPDGKVFPSDDKAESVLAALRSYIEEHKVHILHNSAVTGISVENGNVTGAAAGGDFLSAGKVIVATGGLSYPKTGSTGGGYELARQCGHSIATLRPGLVPLESEEPFIRELQGLTLRDIRISVLIDGKETASARGDLLFTHFGVSGPPVLILSDRVADALLAGSSAALSLRLRPELAVADVERRLQKEFESCGPKNFSQYLKDALPRSLAPVVERVSAVAPDKRCGMISREERRRIAALFHDFRIRITRTRPVEEATVTRGGVVCGEIEPQTMESRLVRGLYFCGEVIDVHGITGGYNLQQAFSTGFLAGESAGSRARDEKGPAHR